MQNAKWNVRAELNEIQIAMENIQKENFAI